MCAFINQKDRKLQGNSTTTPTSKNNGILSCSCVRIHHINIEIALSPPSHFDTFINILNSYTIYIYTHIHIQDIEKEKYTKQQQQNK